MRLFIELLHLVLLHIICLFMTFQSVAKGGDTPLNLDVSEYPNLIYKAKSIKISRDLFVSAYSNNSNINTEVVNYNSTLLNSQQHCQQWLNTLTYYGTFSVGDEVAVMVKAKQSNIIKVGIGEPLHGKEPSLKELRLKSINQTSFIAEHADELVCSFHKLSY